MPPEKHALLSASSASRWLVCTAAPRFEEGLPESTSSYAEEGRLAHAIGELKVLKKFTTAITPRTYTTRLNKLKKEELYDPEMDKTTDLYLEHLVEQAMLYDSTPTVAAEVQVDFSEYVPEGFGTCDCVMIGGDTPPCLALINSKRLSCRSRARTNNEKSRRGSNLSGFFVLQGDAWGVFLYLLFECPHDCALLATQKPHHNAFVRGV